VDELDEVVVDEVEVEVVVRDVDVVDEVGVGTVDVLVELVEVEVVGCAVDDVVELVDEVDDVGVGAVEVDVELVEVDVVELVDVVLAGGVPHAAGAGASFRLRSVLVFLTVVPPNSAQ
jgi:hypothetical protein